MKTLFLFISLFTLSVLSAEYRSTIQKITPDIKKRMIDGNSWRDGCPVALRDLRYIQVTHYDFRGKTKIGELIMHRSVAKEITEIFRELYQIGYPINRMSLVSDFGGNDYRSIEHDNTSAFNCRNATGKQKWSKHAYGLAIDINPIENPYLKRGKHSSHSKSRPFEKRVHKDLAKTEDIAILLESDRATQFFKKRGWTWGGDWKYIKDYQHFQKKLPSN
ncbi:MAG: M15 family metallopeptidase [Campylobacterota bacterium]|nr:M15 family metallopeptidase [Campylobacterota bacterium]